MSEKETLAELGDLKTVTVPPSSRVQRRGPLWRRPAAGSAIVHRRANPRTSLESQLSDAVRNQMLTVHYQPQFDMHSGLGIGVEALARWTRPDGGSVLPSVFIPIAERNGLISELGEWVLQSACKDVALWTMGRERLCTLSVNVSAHQVDSVFCAALESIMDRTGFPAERLELEITESALFGDPKLALECLSRWKELGVRIALDDFGTGYCSLSYLSQLPVDRVKLDKSFTQTIVSDRRNAVIVRAVIDLCGEMGISVLAEGVETELQLEMLKDYGCGHAQGYLMASPAPQHIARAILGKRWGNRPTPTVPRFMSLEEARHAS